MFCGLCLLCFVFNVFLNVFSVLWLWYSVIILNYDITSCVIDCAFLLWKYHFMEYFTFVIPTCIWHTEHGLYTARTLHYVCAQNKWINTCFHTFFKIWYNFIISIYVVSVNIFWITFQTRITELIKTSNWASGSTCLV